MTSEEIYIAESYMTRAEETLKEAKALFQHEMYVGTVNRAYYAMFYAAYSMLALKSLYPETHGGVHNLFYKHYIKANLVSKEIGMFLRSIYEYRREGDYEVNTTFSREEVEKALNECETYIGELKKLLESSINKEA